MSEVLSGDLPEDYSPGNSLSTLRKWYEGVREEPGYIRVFGAKKKKKKSSWMSKDYCYSQKTEISSYDFSAFVCMGISKSLGSLKLFFRCAF